MSTLSYPANRGRAGRFWTRRAWCLLVAVANLGCQTPPSETPDPPRAKETPAEKSGNGGHPQPAQRWQRLGGSGADTTGTSPPADQIESDPGRPLPPQQSAFDPLQSPQGWPEGHPLRLDDASVQMPGQGHLAAPGLGLAVGNNGDGHGEVPPQPLVSARGGDPATSQSDGIRRPESALIALTGEPVCSYQLQGGAAGDFRLSPDGRTSVFVAGCRLRGWDLATGRERWSVDTQFRSPLLAAHPTGKYVAVIEPSGVGDGFIQLLDLFSGRMVLRTNPIPNEATFAVFVDARTLAVHFGRALLPLDLGGNIDVGKDIIYFDLKAQRLDRRGVLRPAEISPEAYPTASFSHLDGSDRATVVFDGMADPKSSQPYLEAWDVKLRQLLGTVPNNVHTHQVYSVAISGDRTKLATGGNCYYDPTVRLWELDPQKRPTGSLATWNTAAIWLAFSPDSKTLAIGNSGGVTLWDCGTRAKWGQLPFGSGNSAPQGWFTPDGDKLISAMTYGLGFASIRVWQQESADRCPALRHAVEGVQAVAFAPDGKRIASAGRDGAVRIWDRVTGTLQQKLVGHTDWITGLAFAPDGNVLASCGQDRTVRLWDLRSSSELHNLKGHEGVVYGVAYRPDGAVLASVAADGFIRLWDAATGSMLRSLASQHGRIRAVAFHPTLNQLATAGEDMRIRLWDADSGTPVHELAGHTGEVRSIGFSPDGRQLVSGGDDKVVLLWDLYPPALRYAVGAHADKVTSVAFSPEGLAVASAGEDGEARLWEHAEGDPRKSLRYNVVPGLDTRLGSGTSKRQFQGHLDRVESVAFSPDGCLLATASLDGTVRIGPTGLEWEQHDAHEEMITSLALSPDGRLIATAGEDGMIKLWGAQTREHIASLDDKPMGLVEPSGIQAIGMGPSSRMLAAGLSDGTLKIWGVSQDDLGQNKLSRSIAAHHGPIHAVAVHPHGQTVATAGADGYLRVWDVASGDRRTELKASEDALFGLVITPDGSRIAAAGRDRVLRIWEFAAPAAPATLEGHQDEILRLAVSPDGARLASGSGDGTVIVWGLPRGEASLRLAAHEGPVTSIAFESADRLLTAGYDRTIKRWDVKAGKLDGAYQAYSMWARGLAVSKDGKTIFSICDKQVEQLRPPVN